MPKYLQSKTNRIIQLSLDRPTGNFWIDTGLVVLINHFGEGQHTVEEVLEWLQNQLLKKTGNVGEYYDLSNNKICKYEKVNWAYPINFFIKVSGKASKIKINDIEYPTHPPKFELKLKLSKKEEPCDICWETAPLTEAKMWMYPFIVDPEKFGNFYSGNLRGLKLCARCALAGLAGYLGWLWKAQGGNVLHFFIFHSELREMKRLHEEVLRPLMKETCAEKGGSAPTEFAGPYIHETTLGLLLALFAHIHQSYQLNESARKLLADLLGASATSVSTIPIILYAITGTAERAFNMQMVKEFSKLQSLYRLYEEWLEVLKNVKGVYNPHRQLVQILGQFWAQQGQNQETIWRDRIAQAILEFSDPLPFIEQFLFEIKAKEDKPRPFIKGTLEVFNHYLREVIGMDEKFQQNLKKLGESLGKNVYQNNEMGLLYALRNAKNPEDFYRVLNDVQFRLKITIPEELLKIEKGEKIAGMPWVRIKTLLSIYAMNSYLRQASGQEK